MTLTTVTQYGQIARAMRTCTCCGAAKPDTEFYADPRHRTGLRSECKACGYAGSAAARARRPKKPRTSSIPTQHRVRELFIYEPDAGILTRRIKHAGRAAGEVAGTVRKDGRSQVAVDGRICFVHQVAWLYMTGAWPKETVDHINGDHSDNRFSNLRDVSVRVNCENKRRAQSNNTTGLLGVLKHQIGPNWYAQICVKGVTQSLGSFPTAEEAHAAYLAAKRRLHEGCTI